MAGYGWVETTTAEILKEWPDAKIMIVTITFLDDDKVYPASGSRCC